VVRRRRSDTWVAPDVRTWTPNQVVAYNIVRARELRGWTQARAASQLAEFFGTKWTEASYAQIERSITGARVRQFSADDLVALARGFELPIGFFLTPPPDDERVLVKVPDKAKGGLFQTELLDLVLGTPKTRDDWHQVLKENRIGNPVAELRRPDGTTQTYDVHELAMARVRMVLNQMFGDVEGVLRNLDILRGFLASTLRSNFLDELDDEELEAAILRARENEKRRDAAAERADEKGGST
jgi:transcriptional regulator with XRE-family HTH domain